MPGKARSYSNFYNDKGEMNDTVIPRTGKGMRQEAAIMHSKAKKGKISKDTLKRRLDAIYSQREK